MAGVRGESKRRIHLHDIVYTHGNIYLTEGWTVLSDGEFYLIEWEIGRDSGEEAAPLAQDGGPRQTGEAECCLEPQCPLVGRHGYCELQYALVYRRGCGGEGEEGRGVKDYTVLGSSSHQDACPEPQTVSERLARGGRRS